MELHTAAQYGILVRRGGPSGIVALVDDDNIPKDDWGENIIVGKSVEATCFVTNKEQA